nr:hypothetical protein [Tanacetum cinerariifolium]
MESVKETVKIRVCKGGAWERVDGALEYVPLNCVKRTLILPLLSSYSCLLEAVSERLEIDANSDFMDPQSVSANRKLKHVVGSPKNKKPNERDLLDVEKLRPFGEKIMGSVFGKVKRLSDEDESSEFDKDAETTPIANNNFKEDKFWNMPPLLKTSILDIKKKSMCYGTSSLVRLHDTFDSKEQIKIVLGRKALEEGFQIRYPRSDPQR